MSAEPLDRIRAYLTRLRLARALAVLPAIVKQVERGETTLLDALATLLGEEAMARESRRIKTAIAMSHLPAVKTLEDFDFALAPSVDQVQVRALERLDFIRRRENVLFLGPRHVGKTHLAIALGVAACRAGVPTHFALVTDLVTSLLDAQRRGLLTPRLEFYCRYPLLIMDEMGYFHLPPGGPDLLLQLVNARHNRGSLILTSDKVLSQWGRALGAKAGTVKALQDRLLHHAIVIKIRGTSYAALPGPSTDLRPEGVPTSKGRARRGERAPTGLPAERG